MLQQSICIDYGWYDFYHEKSDKGKQCVEERLNEEKILSLWNQLLGELNNK